MYVDQDGGHVRIPGTTHDVSHILWEGNDIIGIDAHAFPIVHALTSKEYKTTFSCGGHLNTREWIDPVEIGLDVSRAQAKEFAKKLTSKLKERYPKGWLALEKIVVEFSRGPILLFYHTREQLISDSDLDSHPAFREEDGKPLQGYKEYYLHVTPELILEWNKVIMVMQVAAMILELPRTI